MGGARWEPAADVLLLLKSGVWFAFPVERWRWSKPPDPRDEPIEFLDPPGTVAAWIDWGEVVGMRITTKKETN